MVSWLAIGARLALFSESFEGAAHRSQHQLEHYNNQALEMHNQIAATALRAKTSSGHFDVVVCIGIGCGGGLFVVVIIINKSCGGANLKT